MREFPVVVGPVWKFDRNGQFPADFEKTLPIAGSEGKRRGPKHRGRVLMKTSATRIWLQTFEIISITDESLNFKMGYGFI